MPGCYWTGSRICCMMNYTSSCIPAMKLLRILQPHCLTIILKPTTCGDSINVSWRTCSMQTSHMYACSSIWRFLLMLRCTTGMMPLLHQVSYAHLASYTPEANKRTGALDLQCSIGNACIAWCSTLVSWGQGHPQAGSISGRPGRFT